MGMQAWKHSLTLFYLKLLCAEMGKKNVSKDICENFVASFLFDNGT